MSPRYAITSFPHTSSLLMSFSAIPMPRAIFTLASTTSFLAIRVSKTPFPPGRLRPWNCRRDNSPTVTMPVLMASKMQPKAHLIDERCEHLLTKAWKAERSRNEQTENA